MKKYISLLIVCIASILAQPLIIQAQIKQSVYDTATVYEISNDRKLWRERTITENGNLSGFEFSVLDTLLPKALTNKQILMLANRPDTSITKIERISMKGHYGDGLGIQFCEFFYEPYQSLTIQYSFKNDTIEELVISLSETKHRLRFDYILYIVGGILLIVILIFFKEKIKNIFDRMH